MKKILHKTLSLFLMLAFCLGLPAINAAPNIIFTAINDVFARSVSPSNMPTRIGNTVYVPVSFFSGSLGLKSIYNAQYNQLVVFNSSHIMTFDITNSVTYNEQGTVFSGTAVKRNGVYFVPAKSVCDCFGFDYSYVTKGLLGPIVRINSDDNSVSDDMLLEKGFTAMRSIYNEYQATYATAQTPSTPAVPEQPSTSTGNNIDDPNLTVSEESRKVVYLAFEGALGDDTGVILNTLTARNYKATFFVANGSKPEYLLRAAACGHTIGNNLGGDGSLSEQSARASDMIKAITKIKPRLMMIPGGSNSVDGETINSMILDGYRLWDSSANYKTNSASSATIYSAATRYLSNTTKNVVLCLKNDAASAAALNSLAAYFTAHNYEVRPITEINTPINSILDMR